MATDNTGEFMSMAERAAETALRNTASVLGLPVYHIHRNLDEKTLRLLCISVASEALALYTSKRLTDNEALRKSFFTLDDTDLAQARMDGADHPGC